MQNVPGTSPNGSTGRGVVYDAAGRRLMALLVLLPALASLPACATFTETRRESDRLVKYEEEQLRSTGPFFRLGYRVEGINLRASAHSYNKCRKRRIKVVDRVVHVNRVETSKGFSSSWMKMLMGGLVMALGGGMVGYGFSDQSTDSDGNARTPEEAEESQMTMWISGGIMAGVGLPVLISGIVDNAKSGSSTERLGTISVPGNITESPCDFDPLRGQVIKLSFPGTAVTAKERTDSQGRVSFNLIGLGVPLPEESQDTWAVIRLGENATKSIRLPRRKINELRMAFNRFNHGKNPPRLVASATFDDSSGNGNSALDGEENADLVVRLKNEGRGQALGVTVKTSLEAGGSAHLRYTRQVQVGVVEPGAVKIVRVPIKAGEYTTSGQAAFLVSALERYKYDAPTVRVAIQTRAMKPPSLVIAGKAISDGNTGLSSGNGNGVIEAGENVTLILLVQNRGAGDARGVRVTLSSTNENIVVNRPSVSIGDLAAGRYRKIKLAFMVSPRYQGGKLLPLRVELKEERPRFTHGRLALNLSKGETVISTIAIKGAQEQQAQVVPVPSLTVDVDQGPKVKAAQRDDAFGVVIGIENYREKSVPAVTFASRDAKLVRRYMVEGMGIPPENIKTLINAGATKGDIAGVLEQWLVRNVKPTSLVFIYFSGHGAVDDETKQSYLVPYNATANYLSTKGYSVKRLFKVIKKYRSKNVLLAMDACYTLVAEGERPMVIMQKNPYADVGGNTVVLAASSPKQRSGHYKAKRHGLFTYFLLKGMRGSADSDEDGWVTVSELFPYLKRQVKRRAALDNREQVPTMVPEQSSSKHGNLKLIKVTP